jgi:hypothetical protein
MRVVTLLRKLLRFLSPKPYHYTEYREYRDGALVREVVRQSDQPDPALEAHLQRIFEESSPDRLFKDSEQMLQDPQHAPNPRFHTNGGDKEPG